ncbi:hypothetical protein P4S95_25580 [Aneurinibacillus aneurinilyticus]|jgi:hypothetical protein|uniref:Uncharacterized protein n=1 Tax=Aneurinibacillus aneurinilyticus TaxID=1391 RepID=A0A848D5R6_ANEAE|nr:hypothetical protein [Aneurinibacillus aneurinilyticus]MED0673547.1 hypothetical protein [Aneurinibacillus aneurinilyticus]NMF01458.1 hypothetical protein [Aneurinibacillus aneurinilyticus]
MNEQIAQTSTVARITGYEIWAFFGSADKSTPTAFNNEPESCSVAIIRTEIGSTPLFRTQNYS